MFQILTSVCLVVTIVTKALRVSTTWVATSVPVRSDTDWSTESVTVGVHFTIGKALRWLPNFLRVQEYESWKSFVNIYTIWFFH